MSLTRALKNHEEWVLVTLAVFFVLLVAAFFVWGIGVIVVNANKAIGIDNISGSALEFNIEAARKVLNARGITVSQ